MLLHLDVAFWDEETGESLKSFGFPSEVSDEYLHVFEAWLNLSRIRDLDIVDYPQYNKVIDLLMFELYECVADVVEQRLGYGQKDLENGVYDINDPFVGEDNIFYAAVDINVKRKKK